MSKNGAYIIGVSDCNQEVCASSGRISTQKGTALEIFERSHDMDKNTKLIEKVTKSGHTSTIEHIYFNLAFENVSVVVEQFMIEFRLASFTVKSRRYVDFSDSGYYIPSFKSEEDKEKYIKTCDELFACYTALTEKDIPKEDARFVLPYCFYSNFYCSLNGRELVNVIRAMLYGRGKNIKEIHEIGLSLLKDAEKYAPGLFVDFENKNKSYSDEYDFEFEISEEKSKEAVELLSCTDDGEKLVAKTALIQKYNCSSKKASEIIEEKGNLEKILKAVVDSKRPRALESFNVSIRFNGVSLACLTHFARHRMQNINIPSLTRGKRDDYIIPETVKKNEECLTLYTDAFKKMNELYIFLKNKGYSENELIYCILSGNTLDIVTTMNARELLLFMKLRSCTRAQWEIRDYSLLLLKKLRENAPILFSLYGPSCYTTGACPEGKLSCGKINEMKKTFSV